MVHARRSCCKARCPNAVTVASTAADHLQSHLGVVLPSCGQEGRTTIRAVAWRGHQLAAWHFFPVLRWEEGEGRGVSVGCGWHVTGGHSRPPAPPPHCRQHLLPSLQPGSVGWAAGPFRTVSGGRIRTACRSRARVRRQPCEAHARVRACGIRRRAAAGAAAGAVLEAGLRAHLRCPLCEAPSDGRPCTRARGCGAHGVACSAP